MFGRAGATTHTVKKHSSSSVIYNSGRIFRAHYVRLKSSNWFGESPVASLTHLPWFIIILLI